jgi:hypothetical protein
MRTFNSRRRRRMIGLIALSLGVIAAPVAVATVSHAGPLTMTTTSDFDGDGVDDLAMAGSHPPAGDDAPQDAVIIDYSSGLANDQVYPGSAYGTIGFGIGMATGDLNGDDYDDLAVGCVSCEWEWGGATVSIFNGSAEGLLLDDGMSFESGSPDWGMAIGQLDGNAGNDVASTRGGDRVSVTAHGVDGYWQSTDYPITGEQPADDPAGSLAIGDVTGDGVADLVVGSASAADGGAVTLFAGPVTEGSGQRITGTELDGSLRQLGASVAIADVTGDGRADVVAGAPASLIGGTDCGAAAVLRGSASGVSAANHQLVSQQSANVPGSCETGDRFGASLAMGNIDGDTKPEAVIGVPGEALDTDAATGMYTVLQSASAGLTGTGSFAVSQRSANVPGTAEAGDRFGTAISLHDMNGAGGLDVHVSAPGEDVGDDTDAGQVVVALSGRTGAPASGTRSVNGTAYQLSRLGWNLA